MLAPGPGLAAAARSGRDAQRPRHRGAHPATTRA